ncbi:hypothetical protein RclHR1_00150054 [Rhizophagus clarus]|uniref:Uncharacterized protein n=1 Tax=Rhizophagus clarus TaxID=94130 RepID=A0A2Z6R6V2_9GLOM|nr:hypothetical protein RclHR1_00150054 [Rhizophagus clarus]
MTNLGTNLNSATLAHMAIRIRLQTAQLRLGVPKSILTCDIEFLKSNDWNYDNVTYSTHYFLLPISVLLGVLMGQYNNSLNTMIRGRMMDIKITQSPADQMEWNIEGGVHAICIFLHEHKANGLIHKFNNHKCRFSLIYFKQIIIESRTAISWALFKQLQGTSTRGKVATWFKKLTCFIENGAAPLADDTVRECRFWSYIEA